MYACLAILALLLAIGPPAAHAVYVNRYTTTTNGAITFTGNSLGLDGSATSGTPGIQGSIGAFTTVNTGLQFGSFPAGTTNNWTLNSSAANLAIPAGSTILFAELIWSGSYSYGGQDVSASINNSITFTTPSGTYSVAPSATSAQTIGVAGANGTCATAPCRYVRSANVTGLVQIGGAGSYRVGAVPATANVEANNNAAGWTLAVVYGNPSLPPRNMNVFIGSELGGAPATGVSGFCTNLAGPVKGRLLVSAVEADAFIAGDQMRFGPTTGSMIPLSGGNNAQGNFFGGQINGDTGALDTSGTFGDRNHNPIGGTSTVGARQGYDITNVDASPALINGQTAAVAQGTTSQDQYTINALGIQIDVGAPKFPLVVKTANRTVTAVGDIVTYTITLDNTAGTANASNVFFTDAIPPGMSFRAGTVVLNGTAQPSFNPLTGFGVGTINAGQIGTVSFQVNVDALPAAPAPAQFVNKARWTYDFISCAGFQPERGVVETNANILPAVRLAPAKTVSPTGVVGNGSILTYTIAVPNTGATASSATTLTDPIPAGTTYVAGSTTLNGLPVADVAGVMPFAAGAPINSASRAAGVIGASETATVAFRVTVNAGAPSVITNSASIDPDGPGPGVPQVVTATNSPLTPPVSIKSFAPTTISAGQPSELTVLLSNANAIPLELVAFSDTLPAGMVIADTPNASTTCGPGTVQTSAGGTVLGLSGGSVPSNGSCTVKVSVTSNTPGTYTNTIPIGAVTSVNAGSNVAATSATLTALRGPAIAKAFSPATIANGVSTLTITLVNPTPSPMTAASFTDNFPAGVRIAATPAASNGCGGTLTATAAATSLSLTGATIPAANVCYIQVDVTASAAGAYTNIIPAGGLSTSAGVNGSAAQATLTVSAPLVSKSFAPNPVGTNLLSALNITLTNPSNTVITGVAFTDTFPTTPGAMTLIDTVFTNTCGGGLSNNLGGTLAVGSTGIRLTGGTIPAGGTCSITVNVRGPAAGSYVNTIPIGGVTTSNSGSNTIAASATLSVGRPSVQKAFGTIAAPIATVAAGAIVPMTIQLRNPNAANVTNTTLTDIFPAGMTLANTTINSNTCAGTFTNATGGAMAIGSTGIRLNNATIAANATCAFSVNVRAATAGSYTNTIAAGGLVSSAGSNAFPASAVIAVLAPPTIVKSFSPASISQSGTSLLTIVLSNSNTQTLNGAAFTDVFPATPGAVTLANATTTNTCGGVLSDSGGGAIGAGDAGLRLTGGSIPGNGSCTITAAVTATVARTYTNTIAAGGLTTSNGGNSTSAANATLTVAVLPPAISKAFAVPAAGRGVPTRLTFTITNPNAATILTGVQFSDAFPTSPGAMRVAPAPNATTVGCGTPTFAPVAGANSVSMTAATIASLGTCTVAVNVVANVPGTYANISGAVSSSNGGTGSIATNSLRILSPPTVTKSFSVNPVSAGASTVLSVVIGNPNGVDALTGVTVNDVYPAGLTNTAAPAPTVTCSSGSSATATGGAANGNSVGLTGGSLAAGGFCSVTVNVSAAAPGSLNNVTGVVGSSNAGNGTTASSVLAIGTTVSGFVYADSNVNATKDGAEAGTGLTLYAKLLAGGVTRQVVPVNTSTGAFGFAAVLAGSYTIIIDDNNSAADTVATIPAPWIGTQSPSHSRTVTVAGTALINQNFGLSMGATISGRVFRDNGVPAGTANDGVLNGAEPGIANVTLRLTDCAATTLASATTDGAGQYSLRVPASVANGANLCVVETNPPAFVSTGGTAGTSAGAANGAYSRTSDTISFVFATAVSHSNLNFGDVPVNTFSTDGVQSAMPGSTLNYAHTFVANSAGQLSFVTTSVATPSLTDWSDLIYRDSNCNGVLDASEPVLSTTLSVVTGDTVCIIIKAFVPASAPFGAQNQVTVTATFNYSNAAPGLSASYTRVDNTTVGSPTSAGLSLTKLVDRALALPGDTLVYTITYRNNGSDTLTNLVINDATPAYTVFQSAGCGANPSNITSCVLTKQPAVNGTGALVWTLDGGLLPGATSTVTFSVQVIP